jgi:aspartate racemase
MGAHAHPEITMHTPSLAQYVEALDRDDLDRVAELMLRSAEILANAGADFLICPDNTIHQAFERVQLNTPLPWLHIAEVTAKRAKLKNHSNVAILGTASLTRSDLYPRLLAGYGIDTARPPETVIDEIDRIIFDELVPGTFLPASRARFSSIIQQMANEGCDAVILGCTEIPLIVTQEDSILPILDTTRLLAHAALDHALIT